MTSNAGEPQPLGEEAAARSPIRHPISAGTPAGAVRRLTRAHVGRVPVMGIVGAIAVVALLGLANNIGTPTSASATSPGNDGTRKGFDAYGVPVPAASFAAAPTAAPAMLAPESLAGQGGTVQFNQSGAPLDTTQIVKTGSMSLEVADLNKAIEQARSTIIGMGGYVSDSSRSGDGQSAVATVTYRLPVARWDDALTALHGLASRLISEQTNSTDVTAQVIDLEARLTNLRATESALQGIMARATLIPDVLAVQEQLTNVEGQIEQLTAQQNHLKDQAAMSTLSVTFMTPSPTVVTTATRDWELGAQVDQAVAALVHIGQGLATIAVWVVIVGVPVGLGLVALIIVIWIARRMLGRRPKAPTAAAQV